MNKAINKLNRDIKRERERVDNVSNLTFNKKASFSDKEGRFFVLE